MISEEDLQIFKEVFEQLKTKFIGHECGSAVIGLRQIRTACDLLEGYREMKGALKVDNERLIKACEKASVAFMGCDSAEQLADEILSLKTQLSQKDAVIEDLKFCLKSTEGWNEKLEKENEKMRECLKYFAQFDVPHNAEVLHFETADLNFPKYLRKARQCLQEVGE